ERGCCLTYDYVTDDATDLLGEKDLDSISALRGLLVSRPADSSFSHKNALHRCVEHAKLWLAQDREHMGFVSSFLGVFGFAVGIPLGLLVGFFLFVYSKTKHVKDPVVRPISELGPNALQELLPEIPLWVKTPDYERVDWLNKFLLDMWPFLDTAICKIIRSTTQPIFAEYTGKYQIKAIDFDELSLGTLPPTVCGKIGSFPPKTQKYAHFQMKIEDY
ncbi:Synaptotagmin-1, partial [Glycine soja]